MSYRSLIFCLSLLFTLVGGTASARHIKGGWMNYTYAGKDANGKSLYNLVIKVYRDCGVQTPGQNDGQINITVFENGSSTQPFTTFAPQTQTINLSKTTYSECISPKPQVCYVILEYATQLALDDKPQGYTIAFERCCRINGILNLIQPSDAYGNTYTLTIPGNAVKATYPQNSSPVFNLKDTVLVCYNSKIELDYGAADPDNDSLSYYFIEAYLGAGQSNPNPAQASPPPYNSVPYEVGFSANDPFGTNLQIDRRTGLITGMSPSQTGEYVVAVGVNEFRDGKLIATTRKELHVNVANCSLAAVELPLRITSCDGFTVNFENLNNSPLIQTYHWDFGVKNIQDDTSRVALPAWTYTDTGRYTAKLIINKGSSCADSNTTQVWVYPGFFPKFKAAGSCYLNPFNFVDETTTRYGAVNRWRWDFGNTTAANDTSLLRNPSYTFPNPGDYNVQLIAYSNLGCEDTVSVKVSALNRPDLTLPFKDTLICSIDTLQLKAVGTGTFTWRPSPSLINGNTATPLVFPKQTTYYPVTLSDRGCTATDSIKVNVLDFITLFAGNDTTICLGDAIQLFPQTQGLGFRWSPGGLFSNFQDRNPIITPTQPSTRIDLIANLGKCVANDFIVITAVPYPTVDAGNDTTICFATTATLNGQSDGSKFLWTPSATVSPSNALVASARPSATTMFTLTVSDTKGCPKSVSDSVLVTVRPPIFVRAGNDTTAVYTQPLQFNVETNAPLVTWSPATGLSTATGTKPIGVYRANTLPDGIDTIRYLVTGITPEGCSITDDILVKLFKTAPTVFMPNAFTPNTDGRNDVIRPTLAGIQALRFYRVFNRYGALVFETTMPGRGWDGRIKGVPQPSGAYVYQISAITYEGNPVNQKGSFVLIR